MVEKKKKKNTKGTIVVQAIVTMIDGTPINVDGKPLPVGQSAKIEYTKETKQGVDNIINAGYVIEVEDIESDISTVPVVE